MPYLESGVRASLDDGRKPVLTGELNYVLSKEIDAYITRKGLGYAAINDVIGVLECLKLEVYRRIAAGYEDEKSRINGEVFLNAR
jgi:hypothetical protein